jgi:hypothetical protein
MCGGKVSFAASFSKKIWQKAASDAPSVLMAP